MEKHFEIKANREHESFLEIFFSRMNERFAGQWCVLHSYHTLPYYSESDVDMAFSGPDLEDLERLIVITAENTGWRLYQKLWYDVQWCCYYVLREKKTGTLLAIDFLTDNHGIGRYGFKTTVLTRDCHYVNDLIPVPDHETALSYKLVKRIEKGRSLLEDEKYLKYHFEASDEQKIASFLKEQYGSKGKSKILSYLNQERDTMTDAELQSLKQKRKRRITNLTNRTKFIYWETMRVFHRVLHPSGMLVYIPILEEKVTREFTKILRQKVGILFRFVQLDASDSTLKKFKGMAGSTLVISPKAEFEYKKMVRYHGIYSKYVGSNSVETLSFDDLDAATDTYLSLILKALFIRIPSKVHING